MQSLQGLDLVTQNIGSAKIHPRYALEVAMAW